jgi:hypothetical protein
MRRFLLLLLGVLALTCSASCAKKPTMHLDHAIVQGVQITSIIPPQLGILMVVVVNVYNPNSYDVAVRSMTGTASIGGYPPIPVSYQGPQGGFWMPAGQTTQMSVPIQVPVQLAMAVLQQSYTSPYVSYHMTGKANVTATSTFKIEADDYSVDESGFLDRQQIAAAVQSVVGPAGVMGPRR